MSPGSQRWPETRKRIAEYTKRESQLAEAEEWARNVEEAHLADLYRAAREATARRRKILEKAKPQG
ncbi:MAG: hypothetical protein ABSD47_18695 [Candidatus Methylomirabilota bacterium]